MQDGAMAGSLYNRRQFLAGAAGGAASLALGRSALVRAQGAATARAAAQMSPAGSDLGAVKHVVFLMHENRSFDHYFGTLQGVRGFNDHIGSNLGAFSQSWPGGASSKLLPFHLDTKKHIAECTYDLTHAWTPQHASWNGGAMDSFVSTHTSPTYEGPELGTLTMGYYEQADVPFSYALAKEFTVCDAYHCSVLGPTHPNRLFHVSGTNDPDGTGGGPVLITNTSHTAGFSVSWPTMPESLETAGVSWKVYNPYGPNYRPGASLSMEVSDNMLLYFSQYSDPNSTLYKKAFNYYGPNTNNNLSLTGNGPNDFAKDVAAGQLPAVSWIIPPIGYDSHPPAPPGLADWYTHQVLKTLTANPEVWASTVLFVSYDENDGFFDHVPPPTAPLGTPGEYVTVDPLPAAAGGIAGPIGLGMRVPMLVVSPFSTGGYVCSDVFDHTSQLRFLETLFGVTVPNLSAWRRATTGDLTSALPHLNEAVIRVPRLHATSENINYSPYNQCTISQIREVNPMTPPYPIPAPQTMVKQHRGTLIPTPT
jgi:phospholipase C